MDERYHAALFVVLTITTCPENIVDIFWSQSQSKNTSQNLKTRPRIQKCFGFWEVFWILGTVFGFWDVFWILGSVFEFWEVFWILGCFFRRTLERVLDSGKYFWIQESVWILGCVLDLGTCFVPRPAKGNLSNLGEKKNEKAQRPRRPKRRILGEQK